VETIAVVIVNFNGGAFLSNCLSAVYNQSSPATRVVIVDNGSSDGSVDRLSEKYPDIELIKAEGNLGFARANNLAINSVEDCHWLALLNPDTVPSKDWLSDLRQGINQYPDTKMFSCRLVCLDNEETLDGTGDHYHVSGLVWRRDHGSLSNIVRNPDEEIFSPCGAAALYDMSLVKKLGGMDDHYFCYNEDVDLAFRMRLKGASCVHLDHCIVKHKGSGITGSESDFTVYHGHRNLVWTFFKNMPGSMLWLYLPQHILMNLITIVLYTFKGRGRVIVRSKWDALLGLPRVLRQRRAIQESKTVENSEVKSAMITAPFAYFSRHRY